MKNKPQPRKPKYSNKLIGLAVGTMLIAVILLVSIHYPEKAPQTDGGILDGQNEYGDGGLIGMRIENATGGNWTLTMTSGSIGIKGADLVVNDPKVGVCLRTPLSLYDTEDFTLHNNNVEMEGSLKLFNAGDVILLKCSSPHLKSGNTLSFYRGNHPISDYRAIP